MIKIGVDGRLLQGNLTGVGKYVLTWSTTFAAGMKTFISAYIATGKSHVNSNIPV